MAVKQTLEGRIFFETAQSGLIAGFPYSRAIFDTTTEYQQATLLDTEAFGKTLFLDNILNSTESDEHIYHESIVHPAMLRAEERKRVLIIGGAEGGVAREVLKYEDVEHVDMVDIDQELVNLCKQHLSQQYSNPWIDQRLNVYHTDGRQFLEQADDPYDVIILDLNEATEDGPARFLFTKEFYELTQQRLNTGGYCSIQSEWLHTDLHVDLTTTQGSAYDDIVVLDVAVPSFLLPEAINLACKSGNVSMLDPEIIDDFLSENSIYTKYYCGTIDLKMRTMPPGLQSRYHKNHVIFSDQKPPTFEESRVS